MAAERAQTPRKRGRPTEAERTQRRDDILDVAVQLFAARGFHQVTLDDIAGEAHVTKRTIYAYFGDRTEIFLASVERLRDRTVHRGGADGSLEELAVMMVRALHSDEAIALHRLMIIEAEAFPELARRFYDEGPRAYISALRERIPEGHDAMASALFALLLGEPHRQRLLGLAPAPSDATARRHARAALAQLGLAARTA
ncbi:TetR/AcrR family transcriptional regulator [Microbacterium sp. SSW1-49]|jgi:AcrR family transcriptional regulator|uniref:TetR/AcrR family transcriptional regulator n=1 Tax=Microbacterium croceum TaxID=2851645 RepID=A0ABT0FGL6_9MICO|nr:TetR/AcrR family transcriptional regulator [Microbacterium croceum]MCK2037212.1 TetR/AcrR family transcriptional regulator [Microbacterium croceum]